MKLRLEYFTFNEYAENTYLLIAENGECIIIDPGCSNTLEEKRLSAFIAQNQLLPKLLLNTHCHIDHVLGNAFVKNTYNLKLGIHPLEQPIHQGVFQYAKLYNIHVPEHEYDYFLDENEEINFNNVNIKLLLTPGHTPGSVCFYLPNQHILIGGDVLFRESVGRWDFPGGNRETLLNSIQSKLFTLPDDTEVFPGHGSSTTIAHEKKFNPFFQ